ncbi:MAG: DUF599 family protein [Hyphomicrobiales bacterium]|nr:DUF599 family protein [Hyphomicrobiales bacterium]
MEAYWADICALSLFLATWLIYNLIVERRSTSQPALNRIMHIQRQRWMEQMAARDVRIVDTAITSTLQNGTAFFASTSLLAIGGAATMLRSTDDILRMFSDLPFAATPTRALWDLKVAGLAIIFGYAFFKFAWSYRLFNYSAILIGATPPANSPDAARRLRAARRAGEMNTVAARHFVAGQRAFFFAFAYLGWFLGPFAFMATTILIIYVVYRRQFHSDALAALKPFEDDET